MNGAVIVIGSGRRECMLELPARLDVPAVEVGSRESVRDRVLVLEGYLGARRYGEFLRVEGEVLRCDSVPRRGWGCNCLLYTSDAADDLHCVDLGGRRIIK